MTSLIICALVVWFCAALVDAARLRERPPFLPRYKHFGYSLLYVALIMGALGGSVTGLVLLVRMAVWR